jgi:PPOX class probable F420-dependent enzyme
MVERASSGPTDYPPRTRVGDIPTRLDPDLVALASERNIGALATIKGDGRPQLSAVNFTFDPAAAMARVSVIEDLAIANNLRSDPRASIFVASPDGWRYVVLEGTAVLSPVALTPHDDTVEELLEVFRTIRGEDPHDRDKFRAAMVADRRLVARLYIDSAYGLTKPLFAMPA